MKARLRALVTHNSLFTNSLYLLISNAIATASGFLFWILVARMYSTEDIGLATSLSSLVSLTASLSQLGLNTGLLRFLPTSTQKNEKINSSIIISALVSGILSLFFLLTLSKPLQFIRANSLYATIFVIISIITTLNFLTEAIFIAFRASLQVLIKSIIHSGIKLILPFALVSLGAFGVFSSLSAGTVAALAYALIVLAQRHAVRYAPKVNPSVVKKIAGISFATYVSGLITSIPSYVLPVFIHSTLGPTQTAYYYMAATTANVLFVIPLVITQNLLVEGSYDEKLLAAHTKKASLFIAGLLIPAIAVMVLFGNYILLVFGKQYSTEGIMLLRLLALSGLLVGANYIFGTLLTIHHRMKLLIAINVVGAVVLLGGSYLLLPHGITGIGYATILSQAAIIVLYILSFAFGAVGGYRKKAGTASTPS